eukprot:7380968-Prymnesium_polylepis.3
MTSVRSFVEASFSAVNVRIEWQGTGADEIGIGYNLTDPTVPSRVRVRIDPKYYRPAEVEQLLGNATKAHDQVGWTASTSVSDLCKEMVESDLRLVLDGDLES